MGGSESLKIPKSSKKFRLLKLWAGLWDCPDRKSFNLPSACPNGKGRESILPECQWTWLGRLLWAWVGSFGGDGPRGGQAARLRDLRILSLSLSGSFRDMLLGERRNRFLGRPRRGESSGSKAILMIWWVLTACGLGRIWKNGWCSKAPQTWKACGS